MKAESIISIPSLVALLATFVGIVSAMSVYVGIVYHYGYMDAFDVPRGVFPIPIEDAYIRALTIYEGAVSLDERSLLLWSFNPFVLSFLVFAFAVLFLASKLPVPHILRTKFVERFENVSQKAKRSLKAVFHLFAGLYVISFILWVFLFFLMLFQFFLYSPYLKGKENGVRDRDEFMENGFCSGRSDERGEVFSRCITLKRENGSSVEGLEIMSSENYIALFTAKGTVVERLDNKIVLNPLSVMDR